MGFNTPVGGGGGGGGGLTVVETKQANLPSNNMTQIPLANLADDQPYEIRGWFIDPSQLAGVIGIVEGQHGATWPDGVVYCLVYYTDEWMIWARNGSNNPALDVGFAIYEVPKA